MGYYTAYSIDIEHDEGAVNQIDEFYKELLEVSKDSDGNFDVEYQELVREGVVYGKLYDIEDYIDELAPKYPGLLILLEGNGEDHDDRWEHRWKGTESEVQKAEIPPFKNVNLKTKYEKKNNC